MSNIPHGPWENEWTVVDELGLGGQGMTYLVKHQRSSQQAVLKLLKKRKSARARNRMKQEVTNLQMLHNSGIKAPKVLDDNMQVLEDAAQKLYFIMEYVDGEDLRKTVEDHGPFSLEQAAKVVQDLSQVIAEAHDNGILHRDLKPAEPAQRNQ